jgi:hypothetical protein
VYNFWSCWSSGRNLYWTPHTPVITSTSNLIIHYMWCEEMCRVYTTELLLYAKRNKTALMKLILWDMTYSLVPIPFDLLAQLLTDWREIFLWRIKLNHSVWYPYHMWGVFLKSLNVITVNRYNIRTVFKTRHTLKSSLVRTRPIRAPQKDHWTYVSGNTGKI